MFSSPSHFGTLCSNGLASWVRRVKEGKGRGESVEESKRKNEGRERGRQGEEWRQRGEEEGREREERGEKEGRERGGRGGGRGEGKGRRKEEKRRERVGRGEGGRGKGRGREGNKQTNKYNIVYCTNMLNELWILWVHNVRTFERLQEVLVSPPEMLAKRCGRE